MNNSNNNNIINNNILDINNNNIADNNNINNISDSINNNSIINNIDNSKKKKNKKVINNKNNKRKIKCPNIIKKDYANIKLTDLQYNQILDKYDITMKQEKFCRLYASDKEFFGNGVQSYIAAFNIDITKKGAYNVAGVNARNLLKNPKILAYINDILEVENGFNDVNVDKQLAFIIAQNADFGSKLGAIKEYNALKSRIKQRIETTNTTKIEMTITEEEKQEINNRLKNILSLTPAISEIGLVK